MFPIGFEKYSPLDGVTAEQQIARPSGSLHGRATCLEVSGTSKVLPHLTHPAVDARFRRWSSVCTSSTAQDSVSGCNLANCNQLKRTSSQYTLMTVVVVTVWFGKTTHDELNVDGSRYTRDNHNREGRFSCQWPCVLPLLSFISREHFVVSVSLSWSIIGCCLVFQTQLLHCKSETLFGHRHRRVRVSECDGTSQPTTTWNCC